MPARQRNARGEGNRLRDDLLAGAQRILERTGNEDDVTLTAADVLTITGGVGTLFIWGDGSGSADDDVALTGGGWAQVGDNLSSNGRTYDVFQNGSTLVAVDTDVEVALS